MATTVADIQLRLAYRMRENSTPNDVNEKARRLSYINEGNRKVLGENYWWFLKTIGSDTTVANQEIYSLPTYFRDMIELRIDNKVYAPMDEKTAFGSYSYPPSDYYYGTNSPRFYVYENELHIIPVVSSVPETLSVTSITRSGSTATVTVDNGYDVNTWVTIDGADQTEYNDTFRVQSATSTSFTITVSGTPTTPATGTITCTQRNIVYRYWSKVVPLTGDTSTIQIPDEYADILVAFGYTRLQQNLGRKGSAGDGIEEYNQLIRDMTAEENRRKFARKSYQPPYGEYV
jgi:hypothetical protein